MDQDADEMRYGKGLVNQNWLVKNEEEKLPPLELVRSSFFTSTKNDSETAKHSDRKQEFDKAVNLYTTRKTDIVAKHHLPFSPPPERKKHTYSKNDRDANDIPSLKVSLKPDLRILASEPNQSVGSNTTVTITEEDEKMLHFLKSKGLTLEDIRKITDEIEDDKKYTALSSEKDKTEYSDMEREYFEKIREALLQSKGVRKKELLSFLFYLSLDNHDCVKSLLCRSEMNEDVSQPLASSRGCIFKALKDTMMPHAVRKVHKFLQRHIIGTAKVYDRPTQTQINAHLEGCSKAKKVKCSQPSKMPRRITTKKKAVTKGVQSYAAPTTITRSAQLNLPVTSPMIGPTNNLRERLGQPMAVNEMNTQKVYPSLGYPQNNDVLPQLWIQPPEMYPAQSTRLPQPADYGLDPNARPGVSFPNAQWHTPQYWN